MQIIDINTYFGSWPKEERDLSLSTLLSVLKRNGVNEALTFSTKAVFYDFEEGNAETLDTSRKIKRLLPVATVDPRKYPGGAGVVGKIKEEGFLALRFFPEFQGWPIEFYPFRKIVEEAAGVQIPVMLFSKGQGQMTAFARAVSGLNLPIIFIGPSYFQLAEAVALLRENKNFYLEVRRINTPDALKILIREVGTERLLYGSNSPFDYFQPALLPILKAEISEENKQAILAGNAERLLGLK